jgi:TonB family protein
MRRGLALAGALALVALAACAADAPAQAAPPALAPAPAAPAPATVEGLRASMLASDSILVTRVEVEERVTTDSAGQAQTSVSSKRVAVNIVKGPWMKRFVASFIPPGTALRPELCPRPVGTAGLARPWMLSALWINKDGRGQAYVNLITGCGFAGVAGGRTASLDISAHTDSLLALFQQGLFADSALATVSAGSLPDTTRPRVVARPTDTVAEPLERPAPVYPDSARAAGIEGEVMVRALVGSDGHVLRVEVQASVPGLDAAALAAVKKWRFKPATVDGKPRAVWVGVPVRFRLDSGKPAPLR